MEIYLIRHGEVDHHFHGRFYGGLDVDLSANGRDQADAAGRQLAEVPLGSVYSSPLKRAGFGAERVIHWQQAGGRSPDLQVIRDLREIDRGRWSGMLKSEVLERWPTDLGSHWQDLESWRGHEGESLGDLRDRVWAGFDGIVGAHQSGDRIAMVAHLFPITAILAYAEFGQTQRLLQDWMDWEIETGSVSKVIGAPGNWQIEFVGKVPLT
jgi:broad specificity phosphatase PhoE